MSSALRSRLFSSSKLLILASATMMSCLVPSTAFAQKTVAAKPPVSPEMLAVHSKAKRPVATTPATTPATTSVAATSPGFNSEQGFGGTARQSPGPGCNLFPAPASTGAAVGLSYFGPPPSTVNPSLVGPVQLLNSGTVDASNGTITLPLYKGTVKGKTVWYILTDVSDLRNRQRTRAELFGQAGVRRECRENRNHRRQRKHCLRQRNGRLQPPTEHRPRANGTGISAEVVRSGGNWRQEL